MQRRVDQADRAGSAVQCLEDRFEVGSLEDQQLVEFNLPLGVGLGQDHRLDDRPSLIAEEHVLGPAQADAFCTKLDRQLDIFRSVGVCADTKLAGSVSPRQQGTEFTGQFGIDHFDSTVDDFTKSTVEGDRITLLDDFAFRW